LQDPGFARPAGGKAFPFRSPDPTLSHQSSASSIGVLLYFFFKKKSTPVLLYLYGQMHACVLFSMYRERRHYIILATIEEEYQRQVICMKQKLIEIIVDRWILAG